MLKDRPPDNPNHSLITRHIKLAYKIAYSFAGGHLGRYEDYRSVALLALVEATQTYNAALGAFSTHATNKVRSDIQHHIRDSSFVPRTWIEAYERVKRAHVAMNKALTASGSPLIPIEQVAFRLGVAEWLDIENAMRNPNPTSIDLQAPSLIADMDAIDRPQLVRKALLSMPLESRTRLERYMTSNDSTSDGLENCLAEFKTIYEKLYEACD